MYKLKLSLKKEKKKNAKDIEISIPGFLFYFIIIFFLITTTFDLAVTITIIAIQPDEFFNYEANKLFVWGIEQGWPVIFNPSVIMQLAIAYFYFVSHLKVKETHSKRWIITYIVLSCTLIVASAAHVLGAASWIYSR